MDAVVAKDTIEYDAGGLASRANWRQLHFPEFNRDTVLRTVLEIIGHSAFISPSGIIPPMRFNRITILGVGLMGGSVGMACRGASTDLKIIGYGHNADDLKAALERGAIDAAVTDPTLAVANADLVILAAPVGAFGELLHSIAPGLKPGVLVTDVGSTKRSVVRLAEESLPSTVRFVGSHPMVGGEKHGVQNARHDLFAGSLCILTPVESTDPSALEEIEEFWKLLKMRTVRMTPERHDQLAADISHLPHAVGAALVRIQSPESMQIAARGFADMTRIAAGDAALWRDVFLDNRENLKGAIIALQQDLQQLVHHLTIGDAEGITEWLKRAASLRKQKKDNG